MNNRMRTSPRRSAAVSVALLGLLAVLTACGADVSGKATDDVAAPQVRTVYVTQTVPVTPLATPETVEPTEVTMPVTQDIPEPTATYSVPTTTVPPTRATVAAPPPPQGSLAKKNAVSTATNYLSFSPFSRSGLIQQLEYEQFSTEDATAAVDSLDTDWNEQAAKSAKNYLDMTSFSRGGLIDQLTYEGYTPAQAEYGVSQTGL